MYLLALPSQLRYLLVSYRSYIVTPESAQIQSGIVANLAPSIASLLTIHSVQLLLESRHLLNGSFYHQAQLVQSLPVSLIGCATSRNPRHDAECGAVIVVTLLGYFI